MRTCYSSGLGTNQVQGKVNFCCELSWASVESLVDEKDALLTCLGGNRARDTGTGRVRHPHELYFKIIILCHC